MDNFKEYILMEITRLDELKWLGIDNQWHISPGAELKGPAGV